jgi:CelD/BcsL family acetyltransferase involved in cellulose biosynthesis
MGKRAAQFFDSVVMGDDSSAGGARPMANRTDGAAFAAMTIYHDLCQARQEWLELLAQNEISPYQSFDFLNTWSDTIGKAQGVTPMVVNLRDAKGKALAMLPLAIHQKGPLRVATFLGGRESNINFGLFRRGLEPSDLVLRPLLEAAAKSLPNPPDLYDLRNQPLEFDGVVNPLLPALSRPGASAAYGARLPSEPATLEARLSRDTRKKLRRKAAWLGELGNVQFEHRVSGARAEEIVDALITQKGKILNAANIPSRMHEPAFREFLMRLSSHQATKGFELHAISVSGKIAATYAGLADGRRFSAMLNSYDMTSEIARCSPGDLLLHSLLGNLVSRGYSFFDLGIGEARYKNAVCDEKIELYDTIIPVSWKGAVAAPAFSMALGIKRRIKRDPRLWRLFARARARFRF